LYKYRKTPLQVKFFPAHTKKAYRGTTGIAPLILISVLDGGEWSKSFPGYFTLGKNPPPIEQEVE
jgi:hypothetical protein